MTEFVCLDDTVIRLTAGADWGWGTSTPPTPTFGNFIDVSITGTGTKLTVDATKIILESDITTAMSTVTDSYHSTSAGAYYNVSPLSTGSDGTLLGVTIDDGLIISSILTHESNGVILDTSSGNFTVSVTVPGTKPTIPPTPPDTTGAPPIPDTNTSYSGTYAVQDNGGNTKLKSN